MRPTKESLKESELKPILKIFQKIFILEWYLTNNDDNFEKENKLSCRSKN
jgi:hypothetical protein